MNGAGKQPKRGRVQSMGLTIEEYQRSAALLQSRINQLNLQLSGQRQPRGGGNLKALKTRRYYLYGELAELEQAIANMREYLQRARGE